jgi:hypothetical protein
MVFVTLHGVHEILPDRHRGNGAKTMQGNAMTRLSTRRAPVFAGLFALALTTFVHDVRAEDAPKLPSAAQTDPVANSVMQGFPPPADKTVRFNDGSSGKFPGTRWAFSHIRELGPT